MIWAAALSVWVWHPFIFASAIHQCKFCGLEAKWQGSLVSMLVFSYCWDIGSLIWTQSTMPSKYVPKPGITSTLLLLTMACIELYFKGSMESYKILTMLEGPSGVRYYPIAWPEMVLTEENKQVGIVDYCKLSSLGDGGHCHENLHMHHALRRSCRL